MSAAEGSGMKTASEKRTIPSIVLQLVEKNYFTELFFSQEGIVAKIRIKIHKLERWGFVKRRNIPPMPSRLAHKMLSPENCEGYPLNFWARNRKLKPLFF